MTAEDIAAIDAARAASTAAAELLRFARDGAHGPAFAFEEEILPMLAGALEEALAIEAPHRAANVAQFGDQPEQWAAFDLLMVALAEFREHWA